MNQAGATAVASSGRHSDLHDRIDEQDWSALPGPKSTWPPALRTLVDLTLSMAGPASIAWGPHGALIYNDAFAELIGDRHPEALGQPFDRLGVELETVVSAIAQAMDGQAVHRDDLVLANTQFSVACTPVHDASGPVAGVFASLTKTTTLRGRDRETNDSLAIAAGLLENMSDAFVLLDAGFRVLAINAAGLRLEQVSRDAIVGQPHWSRPDDDTRDTPLADAVRRFVDGDRQPFAVEQRHVWPDGRHAWVEVRGHAVGDGLALCYRDISEKKAIEEAARESDERYRLVVDNATEYAIVTFDAERRITSWSPGAASTFDFTADEVIGHEAVLLYTPEDRAAGRGRDEFERAAAHGGSHDAHWHVRRDGSRVFVNGTVRALHDGDGVLAGFLKIARDETDRLAVEERLRIGAETLRLATDAGEIGIWDLDLTTDRLTWTDRTKAMFGISPGVECTMQDFYDGLHPDDRAATSAAFASAIDPAVRGVYDVTYRTIGREDGVIRWVAARGKALFDEAGRGLRALGTAIDITAVRRDEIALREAQSLNTLILGASYDCIVVLDLDGLIQYVNAGGIASMEIADVADVLGRSWLRVWTGDDHAAASAAVDEARTGRVGRFHGYCATFGGKPRWWDVVVSSLPGPDGRPARLVAIGREITERKQAETRQAFLLKFTGRLLALTDPHEIMTAATTALGEHLNASRVGYGQVQADDTHIALDSSYVDAVAPLNETFRLEDFGARIIARQRQGETIVQADTHDDPEADAAIWDAIDTRAFVSVPLVRDGRFRASMFVHHRDVHHWTREELALIEEVSSRTWDAVERARAESDLRQLNETLEQEVEARTRERDRTWNNSQDLLAVLDAEGRFRALNPAWTQALGWDREQLLNRPHVDFLHPDDRPHSEGALRGALHDALPRYENRLRHKDGSYRWIAWVAAPEADLIYASGRHISAEKEAAAELQFAQDQLRQAQKMEAVGQLTGGLAHDFNNLLTGISGSLELLQVRLAQGRLETVDRYVHAAQGAAKRAAALTHRLLAFSRRQTLDPKPTDINRLVADMEELVRRTVGPQVTVEVIPATALWPTLVDPNQLESALLNLCINARDAMPGGGRLTIETANRWLDERAARARDLPPGPYLSLCVTDTGTGMTPEVVDRAFDPFFTTKPLGEGTGLGLSMVYGFARQSGGHVRIDSAVDRGTTMCLYLPRFAGTVDAPDVPADAPATPLADDGETVLVIDDEPTVRMLVAEVLAEAGYVALEAADGPSGLAILRSDQRVDLLITDIGLPGGLNGREVADAARIARPGLKVLFITGYAENAVIGDAHLDRGMQVLTKPFPMEALARRIKELIAE